MGVAGFAGLAASVGNFVKHGFEAADALGDAAERAGVAVETLSRLKFVAEQNDVEFGALTLALKRWQITLSQAATGSKDAGDSLRLLQLSAAQLKGLSLEDQLKLIADQFARIQDPADQTRIAVELFGRAGEQLVPMLKQGGAAIGALTEEADRLGITLDGKTVKSIDAADKALKKLKATLSSFGSGIAGDIALAIMGPQDNVDAATKRLEDLVKRRDEILKGGVRLPGPEFKRQLDSLNQQIEGAKQGLEVIKRMEEQSGSISSPLSITKPEGPIDEVRITATKRQLEGVSKLFADFDEQTQTVTESARGALEQTKLKLQALFEAGSISAAQYSDRLSEAITKFNDAIDIDPVKVSVQKVALAQQAQINEFVSAVKEGLTNLARSGELTGKSIAKYLLSAFESKLIYKAIENIGTALTEALTKSSGKGGFVGGLSSAIGAIFGHAAGGGSGSGPRVVGEDGPELLFDSGRVMNRRELAFAAGGGGGGGVSIVSNNEWNIDGSASPQVVAQYVESRMQSNNRKQLEQINRLMKNNGFGGLR